MKRKQDHEAGLEAEKWPATKAVLTEEEQALLQVAAAHQMLQALEFRCSHGETVGLADIRAVLKALRG